MEENHLLPEWQTGLMAEEFGIYPWQYLPEENSLRLSPEILAMLGIFGNKLPMEEFLQHLSPESISRFTASIETALNFGSSISQEILLETSPDYRWLNITGKFIDSGSGPLLAGFMRDISPEKKEKNRLELLESWVNAGLGKLKVSNSGGEVLAEYGSRSTGLHSSESPGRRTVRMVDFRNQTRFVIEAETGLTSASAEAPDQSSSSGAKDLLSPDPEINPELSREEQIVALTRTLGLKTSSQVSAVGIFNGSRFEWKAWWKNPSGTAVPSGKYGGEWLPDLGWLIEMEAENKADTRRYWWPQDMLPFPIADAYGKGWMLLTDRLSSGETGLLALRNKNPDELIQKKDEVLSLLRFLHDLPDKTLPDTEATRQLREEIARQEILLKEMNHRAKNNLALAAGLVKMQAGYSEDKETARFLKQTQKRLEALAGLHELMYSSPSQSGKVDIHDYLMKLIEGLEKSFGHPGIRLETQIDRAEISARYANTIGLLINELVSNAFKHAFPENRTGLLRIDFLSRGASFKLLVSDDGPGFQQKEVNNHSLGQVLIEEFVKQLGADMEISHNPGTTYLISIKKSNIGL